MVRPPYHRILQVDFVICFLFRFLYLLTIALGPAAELDGFLMERERRLLFTFWLGPIAGDTCAAVFGVSLPDALEDAGLFAARVKLFKRHIAVFVDCAFEIDPGADPLIGVSTRHL